MTVLSGWRVPRAEVRALAGCTLVIPTYERPDEALALVSTLAALPDPPEEVVVVDGSPHDRTGRGVAEWARRRRLPFDLVYARAPRGLTRQRNAGIDLCRGAYVFFLDDDATPEAGYFTAIRRAFESHPGLGAVGGAVVNQMDRPLSRRWRLRLALGLAPRVAPGVYHPCGTSTPRALLKPFAGLRAVDVLPGCAFAFRREVLDEIRFSEFFAGYSQGEDMEMSLRAGRRWKLALCGEARVVHHEAPAGRPGSFAKGRMEVRNRYFIWKRYAPDARPADRFRFWADLVFIFLMDVAWFAVRPWHPGFARHAGGVAAGVLGCVFAPPRYTEPPVRRHYSLAESSQSYASV